MKTLIKAPIGLFFCEAHLEDLPVAQQSYDPRYCQDCCLFLEHEVSLLPASRWYDPPWAPRIKPSNQNLGDKNHVSVDYHTPVDEKPKQLDFFTITNRSPEQPAANRNVYSAVLETKIA